MMNGKYFHCVFLVLFSLNDKKIYLIVMLLFSYINQIPIAKFLYKFVSLRCFIFLIVSQDSTISTLTWSQVLVCLFFFGIFRELPILQFYFINNMMVCVTHFL